MKQSFHAFYPRVEISEWMVIFAGLMKSVEEIKPQQNWHLSSCLNRLVASIV